MRCGQGKDVKCPFINEFIIQIKDVGRHGRLSVVSKTIQVNVPVSTPVRSGRVTFTYAPGPLV